MRQIKFRAWESNKMKSWEQIQGWSLSCLKHKDVIFMQFTGLKDRNGKEIYEGDIVKRIVYRTCWKEPSEDLIVIGAKDCPFISCGWITEENDSDDYAIKFENEVIGNISENPELLEVKNG